MGKVGGREAEHDDQGDRQGRHGPHHGRRPSHRVRDEEGVRKDQQQPHRGDGNEIASRRAFRQEACSSTPERTAPNRQTRSVRPVANDGGRAGNWCRAAIRPVPSPVSSPHGSRRPTRSRLVGTWSRTKSRLTKKARKPAKQNQRGGLQSPPQQVVDLTAELGRRPFHDCHAGSACGWRAGTDQVGRYFIRSE